MSQMHTDPMVQTACHIVDLPRGTPVMTLAGEMPVEHVVAGDRVVTRSGAMRVEGVEGRAAARVAMIRISARALGHDRPDQDLLLPADQTLLVRGWRARMLFDADQAVVPVSRLIDGTHVRKAARADLWLIRLTLPRAAVLQVGGLDIPTQSVPVFATVA
jgi:hypothetical protein